MEIERKLLSVYFPRPPHIIMITPYFRQIDAEEDDNNKSRRGANISYRLSSGNGLSKIFKSFPTNDDVAKWLERVHRQFTNITRIFTIGSSVEGRQQQGLVVSLTAKHKSNKPAIWINGAVHAREWATVPSVLNVIYQLVTGANSRTRDLIDKFEWYLVPVFNPDGYAYSQVADRMWRKNRRPLGRCNGQYILSW